MVRTIRLASLGIPFAITLAACAPANVESVALHDPNGPNVGDFYALPYPSDARLHPDGTIDLTGYTRGLSDQIDEYTHDLDGKIKGFGTQSAIYFRFSAPIAIDSLPADASASITDAASVFVVDVTVGSPTYGKRAPVTTAFVEAPNEYIGANWLAITPELGIPLREKTTYAAIVTNTVRGKAGGDIGASPALTLALSSSGETIYAPLRTWLATQPALSSRIVNATVFTTQDATSIMSKLREATYKTPAPVATDIVFDDKGSQDKLYNLYTGKYDSPNFQQGTPPYLDTGGNIAIDPADGLPIVSRTENLRFALTVPKGETPPEGWPIILYAHGTGGSYKSFVNDGSATAAAEVKASNGDVIERFAMVSIDQVLHGPREPSDFDTNLAFFNLFNLNAVLDNPKQGAADDFQLLRMVKGLDITAPTTNQRLKFNLDHIYFKGHSQGGLTGPLFVAAEPEIKGAIFSGAGGNLIQALLNKTEPNDIPSALLIFLNPPITEIHPVLNLVQAGFESSDPTNYGRLYFKEPPPGFAPRPIFQSMGIVDHYTPIPTIKILAKAMGVQPIKPELEPIDGLELAGLAWGEAPTQGNVGPEGGKTTGVLLEYNAAPNKDGHFVIFDIDAAVKQCNRFLATHSKTGTAVLTVP